MRHSFRFSAYQQHRNSAANPSGPLVALPSDLLVRLTKNRSFRDGSQHLEPAIEHSFYAPAKPAIAKPPEP